MELENARFVRIHNIIIARRQQLATMRTGHASDRDLTLKLKEYTHGESLEKFEIRTRIISRSSHYSDNNRGYWFPMQRYKFRNEHFTAVLKLNRPQIRGYRCVCHHGFSKLLEVLARKLQAPVSVKG